MPQSRSAQARRWTVLCMAAVAVTLFAFWNVSRRVMHMQTAAASNSGQEFAGAKSGSERKAVLDLTAVGNGSAEGVVLEKQSENSYRKTGQLMRVSFAPDVGVVMGSAGDIRKDAVVHVTGTVGDDKALHASRIVILTGYVTVQ